MKNKRKEYKDAIGWERVPDLALDKGIEFICPYKIDELGNKYRGAEKVSWRTAVMLCYWLNGNTTTASANKVNRNHSSLIHHFNTLDSELFTCDYRVIGKIREIQYYSQKMSLKYCKEVEFKIELS